MRKFTSLTFVLSIFASIFFLPNVQGQIQYDDWPITRESNERDSSGFSIMWVPIGTVWDHRIITYFFENGTVDINNNDERQAVRDAFALWAGQTDLAFLEVCNANEADILLSWGSFAHGDDGDFDGQSGILAHTLGGPPPNDFGDNAGDIHFDDSETWTLNTRTGQAQPIDLVTVAAHEMGHAMGLDHTEVAGSLMLAEYTGSHRFLGTDDMAGIQSLYGNPGGSFVSGPGLLCTSNSVFVLEEMAPANTTVTWSVTPANYFASTGGASTSGTGSTATVRAASTSGGLATITFTIEGQCGIATASRNFWVGSPKVKVPGLFDPEGPGPMQFCQTYYYETQNKVELTGDGFIPTLQYGWDISSTNFGYYTQGNTIFVQPHTVGAIAFAARVSNSCGWSNWAFFMYQVVDCDNPIMQFSIYPNPASEALTIEENSSTHNFSFFKDEKINMNMNTKLANPSAYSLYNHQQEVVLSGFVHGHATIDVSALKEGKYVLEIRTPESVETHHIVLR